MIIANKLRIGYKTTTVVNDLNFKLEEGKFLL